MNRDGGVSIRAMVHYGGYYRSISSAALTASSWSGLCSKVGTCPTSDAAALPAMETPSSPAGGPENRTMR